MNLFLLTDDEVKQGFINHNDKRYTHITKILKAEINSILLTGVVNQSIGQAKITNISKEGLYFTYQATKVAEPLLKLRLVLGSTRPLVMKRLLRDCTAIGVGELSIFNSQNSEKSYLESSLWQGDDYLKSVIDGLSLSKMVTMPMVSRHASLLDAIKNDTNQLKITLDNMASKTFTSIESSPSITVVVGSERGLTDDELKILSTHNFISLNMGNRVVRTETACVMALALALQKLL